MRAQLLLTLLKTSKSTIGSLNNDIEVGIGTDKYNL